MSVTIQSLGPATVATKGADVASATTVTLTSGSFQHITGTTTITDVDFDTATNGAWAWVTFDDALTLTYNATTLKLPGSANILTQAGDAALFVQDSGDNVICLIYNRDATKAPLNSPAFTGNPTAPTPSPGDNDTSIATTAFVAAAISALSADCQPVDAILTALSNLANASGYLKNDGSGGLSWDTPSSGDMTLLGTLTTTSGATQSLTGIPAGTYNKFYIELEGVSVGAGGGTAKLQIKLGSGSTSYGAAADVAGAFSSTSDVAAGFIIVGNVSSSTAAAKSAKCSVMVNGATPTVHAAATPTGTAAGATAVQFLWSSGSSFDAGTIRIYGVK